MVRIEIRYDGELACRAVHGPSGTTISTDAPVDNQGRGLSFSPTDLVATALGTCMATIMGIVARRHDWRIEGMHVQVDKEMTGELPRRIARLACVVEGPSGLPASAVTALSAMAMVGVARTLAEAMADDPVPTQLYGFTRMGHFELTRARRGATLAATRYRLPWSAWSSTHPPPPRRSG